MLCRALVRWTVPYTAVSREVGVTTIALSVVAQDARGLVSSEATTMITVSDTNEAPKLDKKSIPSSIREGEWLEARLRAEDPEGDAFEYELVPGDELLAGAVLTADGNLTWYAHYESSGRRVFDIRLTDALGANTTYAVSVLVLDQSRAPVWRDPLPPEHTHANMGDLVSFPVVASDPDDPALPVTYEITPDTNRLVEVGYKWRGDGLDIRDEVTAEDPTASPPSVFFYVPYKSEESTYTIGIVAKDQWGDAAPTRYVRVTVSLRVNCSYVPIVASLAEPEAIWGGSGVVGEFGRAVAFIDRDPLETFDTLDESVQEQVLSEGLDATVVTRSPQRKDSVSGASAYVLMQRPEPKKGTLYELLPTLHEAPLWPDWYVHQAPPTSTFYTHDPIRHPVRLPDGSSRASVGFTPDTEGSYVLRVEYKALDCSLGEGNDQSAFVALDAVCNDPPVPDLRPTLDFDWHGRTCFPRVRLDASTSIDTNGDAMSYLMWLDAAPFASTWSLQAPSLGAILEDAACDSGYNAGTQASDLHFLPGDSHNTSGHGSRMCFRPDVVGSYALSVNVSDGCTEATHTASILVDWHPACVSTAFYAALVVPIISLLLFVAVLRRADTRLRAARDPVALPSLRAAHILRDVLALRQSLVLTRPQRVTMNLTAVTDGVVALQIVIAFCGQRGFRSVDNAPAPLLIVMRVLSWDGANEGSVFFLPALFFLICLVAVCARWVASKRGAAGAAYVHTGDQAHVQTPTKGAFGADGSGGDLTKRGGKCNSFPLVSCWRRRTKPALIATVAAVRGAQPWDRIFRVHALNVLLLPLWRCCFALLECRYLDPARPYAFVLSAASIRCWEGAHLFMVPCALISTAFSLSLALRVLPVEDRVLRPTSFVRADFVVLSVCVRFLLAGNVAMFGANIGSCLALCAAVVLYNVTAAWQPYRGLCGSANELACAVTGAAIWCASIAFATQLLSMFLSLGAVSSAAYALSVTGSPIVGAVAAIRCRRAVKRAREAIGDELHLRDVEDEAYRDALSSSIPSGMPLADLLSDATPRLRLVACFACACAAGSWEAHAVEHALRGVDGIDLNDVTSFFERAFDVRSATCLEQAAVGLRCTLLFDDAITGDARRGSAAAHTRPRLRGRSGHARPTQLKNDRPVSEMSPASPMSPHLTGTLQADDGPRARASVQSHVSSVVDAEDCLPEHSPEFLEPPPPIVNADSDLASNAQGSSDEVARVRFPVACAYLQPPSCVLAFRHRAMHRCVVEIRTVWSAAHAHSREEAADMLARTGALATLTGLVRAGGIAPGARSSGSPSGRDAERARQYLADARAAAVELIGDTFDDVRAASRVHRARCARAAASSLAGVRAFYPWRRAFYRSKDREKQREFKRQRLRERGVEFNEDNLSDLAESDADSDGKDVAGDVESGTGSGSAAGDPPSQSPGESPRGPRLPARGSGRSRASVRSWMQAKTPLGRLQRLRQWRALPKQQRRALAVRTLRRAPEHMAAWLLMWLRLLPSIVKCFISEALLRRQVAPSAIEQALNTLVERETVAASTGGATKEEIAALDALVDALGVNGDSTISVAAGQALISIASTDSAAEALLGAEAEGAALQRLMVLTRRAPSRVARSLAGKVASVLEGSIARAEWVGILVSMLGDAGDEGISRMTAARTGVTTPLTDADTAACRAAALAALERVIIQPVGGATGVEDALDDARNEEGTGLDIDADDLAIAREGNIVPDGGVQERPVSQAPAEMLVSREGVRAVLEACAHERAAELLLSTYPEVRVGAAFFLGTLGGRGGSTAARAVCDSGMGVVWRLRALSAGDPDAGARAAAGEAVLCISRTAHGARVVLQAEVKSEGGAEMHSDWKTRAWEGIKAGDPTVAASRPAAMRGGSHVSPLIPRAPTHSTPPKAQANVSSVPRAR